MPKRENMTFYATAAAAQEAGFRPCLRCRPETAPEFAAWRGTSNTVSRALALIDAGALDEAGIDRLAERLGVGVRQLRRLFRQHLGASPVSVAQTRRVLLAKQLIHGTRLSMAEVALASGFGSIRRFNEIFHRLFGRPPGDLRRATVADAPSGRSGEVIIVLGYRPPYDWPAMASFLKARAIPGVEVVSSDRYARTIEVEGVHGVVAVEPAPGNALRVAIRVSRLSALPTIISRVRRVFDLAADPRAINAQLAEDGVLAPLVAARPGLRVPGAWDGFELAVRAVLGEQITVAAAVRLAGKLVAKYGLPLARGLETEGLTHVFPRPEHLESANLTALGMPRMRAASLVGLAAAAVADPRRPWRRTKPGLTVWLSFVPCRALASGRRSTSRCANCASRMRFQPATSGCCAPGPMRKGRGRHPAHCSRGPSAGDPGAPTRPSTFGHPACRHNAHDDAFRADRSIPPRPERETGTRGTRRVECDHGYKVPL